VKLTAPPMGSQYNVERRVAVEIMGLPSIEWGPDTKCAYGHRGRYCGQRSWCSDCQEWYYDPYKDYQYNPLDWMELIDRLLVDGWAITMSSDDERAMKRWFVEITRSSEDGKCLIAGWGDSDVPGAAICEAALEAVASK
jgi:hypothetical protein